MGQNKRGEVEDRVRKSVTGFKGGRVQAEMDRQAREVKERQIRDGKGPQYVASPDIALPVIPKEPRLYQKYRVVNLKGERLANCFVLRPDKDKVALEALWAYADDSNCPPSLAADIKAWVERENFEPTGTAD